VAALKPTVPRAWPGDCGRGSATGAWGAADEVVVFWSNEWLKPGEDDRGSLVLREGSTKSGRVSQSGGSHRKRVDCRISLRVRTLVLWGENDGGQASPASPAVWQVCKTTIGHH
jgi:hypothetical protein